MSKTRQLRRLRFLRIRRTERRLDWARLRLELRAWGASKSVPEFAVVRDGVRDGVRE